MRKFLSIDVGGTAIKYGLVAEDGSVSHKKKYDAYFDNYKTPLMETILNSVKEYHDILINEGIEISGIAASVTGDVDSNKNLLVDSCGSIPQWKNIEFDKGIFKKIGKEYPFSMLNDANAAALAETWRGNAKGIKDVIVYTIGTGIGGGVVVDGKILEGHRGFAGNIGHMVIGVSNYNCACGNNGCFEHLASMRALLRTAKESGYNTTGEEIFIKAENDIKLKEIVDNFFNYHGIALGSLLHIFNSEAIIIGGGVSNQGLWFLNRIKKETKKHCLPHFFKDVDFKIAKFTNDAGIIGAVKFFLDKNL